MGLTRFSFKINLEKSLLRKTFEFWLWGQMKQDGKCWWPPKPGNGHTTHNVLHTIVKSIIRKRWKYIIFLKGNCFFKSWLPSLLKLRYNSHLVFLEELETILRVEICITKWVPVDFIISRVQIRVTEYVIAPWLSPMAWQREVQALLFIGCVTLGKLLTSLGLSHHCCKTGLTTVPTSCMTVRNKWNYMCT